MLWYYSAGGRMRGKQEDLAEYEQIVWPAIWVD